MCQSFVNNFNMDKFGLFNLQQSQMQLARQKSASIYKWTKLIKWGKYGNESINIKAVNERAERMEEFRNANDKCNWINTTRNNQSNFTQRLFWLSINYNEIDINILEYGCEIQLSIFRWNCVSAVKTLVNCLTKWFARIQTGASAWLKANWKIWI